MRLRWFTYVVMIYLVSAVAWWTLLLFNKNNSEYLILKKLAAYEETISIQNIEKDYRRQRAMILGEGIFLSVSLLAGIWLIYRGNRKEIQSIIQQKNFLLTITHELKTPLASINLILQTIKNRNLKLSQKTKLTETAEEEVRRLEYMIQNLLLSSDNRTSGFLNIEEVSLVKIVFDIISEFKHRSDSNAIKIEFQNITGTDCTIPIDRQFIKIAIRNVVENALHYGRQSTVMITLKSSEGQIYLDVADNGPGVPKEERDLIFKKFYRLGNEMNRETKGTGLGLYIVRRIVTAHNGNVFVRSNKPSGSIFQISLPYPINVS